MANRVRNELVITGDPAQIDKVLQTIRGKNCLFDFERVIPIPALIRHVNRGGMIIDGQKVREWYVTDDGRRRLFTPDEEKMLQDLGYRSWFDWSLNNWGSDRNPWSVYLDTSSADLGYATMRFQTAWCGPYPIVKRLRELFPDINFRHDWDRVDAHLGTRINVGRPGDARADLWVEPPFPTAEEDTAAPKVLTDAPVDLAELLEFGFSIVRQKLLNGRGKLNRFFVIVAPTGAREIIEEPCGDRDQQIDKIMTMPERMYENGAVAWLSALPIDDPDAEEQVTILASDGSYFHTGLWKVRRDDEGAVVALDLLFREPVPSSKDPGRPDIAPDGVTEDGAR